MSKRRLRVGVIGAGHLGTIHTRLIRSIDDVQLVGIADPSAAVRKRIETEFEAETFADHRELVPKIDAAILAAPTEHHYWLGMELAEAGVHVLVEKPITSTVAEADALVRAAASRKLVLQVGHVERFNPAFTTAASYVHRPRYIEAVRASGYTCRSVDVGVVLDLMIHDIDLVLSLVGSDVVAVDAVGGPVFGPHEDVAHAHLRFANGCVASLNASRTSHQPQRQMQVFSDRAFAGVDFANASATIIQPSERVLNGEFDVLQMSADEQQHLRDHLFDEILPMKEVQVERRNAILDEQHDFVISIRTGQTPQVTGQQGRDALAVAATILETIAENQRAWRQPVVTDAPWTPQHETRRRIAG